MKNAKRRVQNYGGNTLCSFFKKRNAEHFNNNSAFLILNSALYKLALGAIFTFRKE